MKRLVHFIVTNYKLEIWQLVLFYFESRKIRGSCDGSDAFQSAYYRRSSGSIPGDVRISCLVEKIKPTWVLYRQDFSGILLLAITPPLLQSLAPPLSLTAVFHCCSTLIHNRPPTYVADRTSQCLYTSMVHIKCSPSTVHLNDLGRYSTYNKQRTFLTDVNKIYLVCSMKIRGIKKKLTVSCFSNLKALCMISPYCMRSPG